jgi:hypothetical protein
MTTSDVQGSTVERISSKKSETVASSRPRPISPMPETRCIPGATALNLTKQPRRRDARGTGKGCTGVTLFWGVTSARFWRRRRWRSSVGRVHPPPTVAIGGRLSRMELGNVSVCHHRPLITAVVVPALCEDADKLLPFRR